MNYMREFFEILSCFPKVNESIKEGCNQDEIENIEKCLEFQFPADLKELYLMHNGQNLDEKGIFKILSGFDKYSRPKFLSLLDVEKLYKCLLEYGHLSSVFNHNLLPIAADNLEAPDDVICYDLKTGRVLLLWVLIYDPFTPVDWQISQVEVSENLNEFMKMQKESYRV